MLGSIWSVGLLGFEHVRYGKGHPASFGSLLVEHCNLATVKPKAAVLDYLECWDVLRHLDIPVCTFEK